MLKNTFKQIKLTTIVVVVLLITTAAYASIEIDKFADKLMTENLTTLAKNARGGY